jgi:hypothetical protein
MTVSDRQEDLHFRNTGVGSPRSRSSRQGGDLATSAAGGSGRTELVLQVLAVVGLTVFYLLTAPWYHTTAVDSYHFASLVVGAVDDEGTMRTYLWIASLRALYEAVSAVAPETNPFLVAGVVHAIMTALAVVLLQDLLRRYFALSTLSSWVAAGIFAVSYGTWRYAAELEVYAAAAFLSLLILHLTFRVPAIAPDRRTKALLVAAAVGALATLAYQPLGIVAGFSALTFFVLRLRMRETALYLGAYGVLVAAGTALIGYVNQTTIAGAALDTDGKLPEAPGLAEMAYAVVAFLQNILSVNWMFLFEPTRARLEADFRYSFIQELVASDQSYVGDTLYFLTVPVAVVLIAAALLFALRRTYQPPFTVAEAAVIVWLMVHTAMALALHPEGFETWIPALVPLLILVGIRVVNPVMISGKRWIPVAVFAVLLVHNWFAGVGVMAYAERDYNVEKGGPVLAEASPADIVVLGNDWALERYLNYMGPAETFLIHRDGAAEFAAAADTALAGGGRVFILDDTFEELPDAIEILDRARAVDEAARIEIGDLGYVVEIRAAAP